MRHLLSNRHAKMTAEEPAAGEKPVSEQEYVPAGPKPIRPLSKDVINQIAAAEVRCPHLCTRA